MYCREDDGSAFHTCGPATRKLLSPEAGVCSSLELPRMSCHMLIEATTTVANKVNVVSEVPGCMARSMRARV